VFSVVGIALFLVLPFVVVCAVMFPIYVVRRYRLTVLGDDTRLLRRRFGWWVVLGTAWAYGLLLVGMFLPAVLPALSRFLESGGLAAVVPLLFIDFAMAAAFSEERALRRRACIRGL